MLERVSVAYGDLQGIPCEDAYVLFKGVPYAAPPVGDLRLRSPEPPKPWEGVRVCDTWPAACPQSVSQQPGSPYWIEFYSSGDYPPPMDEDCLYLNIWTPAKSADEKLPVMVWLHGGGVLNGYGHEIEFDGAEFVKRGVILITVNYRLNMFGFFCHKLLTEESPHHASGNYGIQDQIQALRWVKENIAAFGGDPDNVMVFGQSGGGRSAQAIACSPLAKGLVQHVAIHSAGGVLTAMGRSYREDLEKIGDQFFEEFNLHSLEELRALPWQELYLMFLQFMQEHGFGGGFNITCDGYVLPEPMEDIIINGKHNDIDYMIGCTIDETKGFFGNDRFNMCAALRGMARCQLRQNRKPMYMFCFARPLPGECENAFVNKAFHSSELWYIFGTLSRCWRPFTDGDYQLSEQMMDYWTNFAKTGDPNGNGLVHWEPFTDPDRLAMKLAIEGCEMADYSDNGAMTELEDHLLALGNK